MIRYFTTVLTLAVAALSVAACGSSPSEPSTPTAPYSQTDLVVGTGTEATNGRRITVRYTGWLYDPNRAEQKGAQFDSNNGFSFTLGAGQVIRGWDQGVAGMRVGGRRRLIIPASLAYGPQGNGPIPPNATIVFDIELLDVQ